MLETNFTGDLTKIVTSIMLYNPYKNINFYLPYMSNAQDSFLKCTKYYLCNFLKETFIQKNGYLLY